MIKLKVIISIFAMFFLINCSCIFVHAQTVTPTAAPSNTPAASSSSTTGSDNSQAVVDLQNKIHDLESKVSDLHNQENSLTSQINVMDSQITLTQYRIDSTKAEINSVQQGIDAAINRMKNLEGSLTSVTKILLKRIVATYQTGNVDSLEVLFSSQSPSDLLSRSSYLQIVQEHDKRLLYDTQQAKDDYANQKVIFEDKKKQVLALQTQLVSYTTQLDQQKSDKTNLLTATQGSEASYQDLLSQAKAQLAGFASFAQNQGGATLLGNQTVCDGWGCYYNQRDNAWGGSSLDGTGYTIASDGCLMTSMAMIATHYGRKDVTPLTINSDRNNFASYDAAYLNYSLNSPSATRSRQASSYDSGIINSELSQGRPVIVGIGYSNGDTHFVVLKSGSNGDYTMNDPFVPNGHDIKFTDHYSLDSIIEVDRVSM